ncbi:hypothetical protein BCV69DRAFT_120086 [Microstroma glucosiphilum]|uniref:Uncharacterized protein n=1 Tax=Pseudomicrostroma glucosiphilum TaxID=1684307 RepID=A0A316TX23_9BASI|nr:hypothetical protein BCV69DRAFT_120086 [Pseudomicrostroma glucosiphilum]PWN17750.1 hypothetical protein BCV69DRAFT_120086 [Pseudomicrostroma glucosiphilum]
MASDHSDGVSLCSVEATLRLLPLGVKHLLVLTALVRPKASSQKTRQQHCGARLRTEPLTRGNKSISGFVASSPYPIAHRTQIMSNPPPFGRQVGLILPEGYMPGHGRVEIVMPPPGLMRHVNVFLPPGEATERLDFVVSPDIATSQATSEAAVPSSRPLAPGLRLVFPPEQSQDDVNIFLTRSVNPRAVPRSAATPTVPARDSPQAQEEDAGEHEQDNGEKEPAAEGIHPEETRQPEEGRQEEERGEQEEWGQQEEWDQQDEEHESSPRPRRNLGKARQISDSEEYDSARSNDGEDSQVFPETPPGMCSEIWSSDDYHPSSSVSPTPSTQRKRKASKKQKREDQEMATLLRISKAKKAKADKAKADNARASRASVGNAVASSSSLPAPHFAAQLERETIKRPSYIDFCTVFNKLEEQIAREGKTLGWADKTVDAASIPLGKFPNSAILFW